MCYVMEQPANLFILPRRFVDTTESFYKSYRQYHQVIYNFLVIFLPLEQLYLVYFPRYFAREY